ncbi:hypothetical protein VFPBJ_02471 [Purpureocillium lilacinum]|uniref:Uncharacterized protein n=1 Tax=Purpureocillium lilacinum TaxID=33203 RepID=A0A179H2I3_PURLI|nr:hypothetical protein VFPBJ_02471 [Purpureocillium lilacinum]
MIAQRGDAGGDTEQQTGGFRVLGFRSPHERLPAEHAAQLARRDRVFAPDSLAKKGFDRKPCLFILYWFALLGYSVTVRVLAAPGDLDSRALGYIDRAQDVEVYCIVTCTLLFFAWLGPVAVVLFPMSVAAVALCCVEAVRLSEVCTHLVPAKRVHYAGCAGYNDWFACGGECAGGVGVVCVALEEEVKK